MVSKKNYKQANIDWLAEKSKEEGVKSLGRGIYYKVLKESETKDIHPTPRSIVTVHYTGWTINGKKFDTSKSGVPLAMRLSDLIDGWIYSLQEMYIGETNGSFSFLQNLVTVNTPNKVFLLILLLFSVLS